MSENATHEAGQALRNYLEMPADVWVKILIAAVVLLLVLVVLKKLAHIGQFIVVCVVFVAVAVIGYKWVRYRDEPEFMTPIVDFAASFFKRAASAPGGAAPQR